MHWIYLIVAIVLEVAGTEHIYSGKIRGIASLKALSKILFLIPLKGFVFIYPINFGVHNVRETHFAEKSVFLFDSIYAEI